jgi:DNA-binding MarR family transcriptional regulator
MCCEPSNTTFVVDKLEALGFLERGPHPDDRRAKLLFLTDAGKDKRAEVIAELSKSSPLSSLTEDEKYRLSELLYRAIAT